MPKLVRAENGMRKDEDGMSINYGGYPYYSEEEVKKRENIARKTGYKEGYTQALRDLFEKKDSELEKGRTG